MSGFVLEWVNLILRWAHMIVGIGWIGTSFYFIALDLSLRRRKNMPEGVYGTAWEVHGGGFYHVEKYLVAPKSLPPDLIWFKWEAYLTWVTGFALLIVQYYWNANAFLINPAVLPLLPSQAVVISLMSLIAGWFLYDALCRSAIGRNPTALAGAVFVLIVVAAYIVSHVFSARGALIHVGAIIGTIMAVNVFGVIIPNQKKITASLVAGEAPDPRLGAVSKQRSVHNNYLTLPVLLLMVSNHYPMLGTTGETWLVIALILVGGAGARHILNRHDAGDPFYRIWWAFPATGVALAAAIYVTAPRPDPSLAGLEVSEGEVLTIVARHCATCHANRPSHEGFDEPPKGVVLVSIEDVQTHADQVVAQTVTGDAMPLGNETEMTEDERRQLGAFLLNR
ncbi:urate hydroxylase PuuD [Bauldia sp.]|uniref:urate hydroxylase PuuD n=1 Tax=Bauldia sp. TaxID=2575872 RepID=UPI003BA9C35D